MRRDLVTSAIAVLVFTVALGLAYPLVTTVISQVVFPGKADGSRIEHDGRVVGSALIGQSFRGRPRLFQPRPSATGYDPAGTAFNNLGPNQRDLRDQLRGALAAYLRRERPYDRGLTAAGVPVDAVTTSASGVDPHISEANARIQAHRVARLRSLPLARVDRLIEQNTDGRALGFLGEPGVNVLRLNLALERERR